MQNKRWKMRSVPVCSEDIKRLSEMYGIPPLVTSILLKRSVESFDEFISPNLDKLNNPFLMKDMSKATKRIAEALEKNELIAVYGDYDVDGITSTAVLTHFLRSHGGTVEYYIPDRLREGYGMNMQAVESLASKGANLIITVDCGITAIEEVQYAKSLGVDVIITDHHECKLDIPNAVAVLNPKRADCEYPFKKLAGIGVVFKLLQALTEELKFHMQALYDEYMDIVALGTIADVMSLTGENRIIVKNGLSQIAYTSNRGIKALVKQAEVDSSHITTGTVGYILAPRINAAGRIGSPESAVELLLSKDDATAEKFAGLLHSENKLRQEIEQTIFDDAQKMLAENENLKNESVIVLAKEGWHHGIIGIVASKITERLNKPCILISLENGMGKGSGRSIKNFNLFAALNHCNEYLVKFGGHELAAGLTVQEENLESFRNAMNQYAEETLTPEDYISEITIDAELPIEYLNLNTVEKFSVMAPYGMGNASPVFLCRNLKVTGIRTLSEGKHLRLNVTDGRFAVSAIGFSMGELASELKVDDVIDIVFNLDANTYRGERRIQILLKDLRFSEDIDK
ncbi:MAG: single-stranded-DNA-specific exonuclease RecJ [Ruminococcaceae bacterium]|nr:single-stranded-DNA-specific exonuclease RecJ [Oscillospiraceae bacterium]